MVTPEQLKTLSGVLDYIGDTAAFVTHVDKLDLESQEDHALYWCSDRNLQQLEKMHKGVVIVSPKVNELPFAINCNLLVVENPRRVFRDAVVKYFYKTNHTEYRSATAVIDPQAKIGKNVWIGEHVVIEAGCIIGDNCSVGHGTVIFHDTVIGNNVRIGANNTIGGIGFGYEKNEEGRWEHIPHLGTVFISDNVEICDNTTVIRAALGKTFIGENTKVDSHVHVGHGVQLGRNSIVCAYSMLGGSAIIGDDVWIAPCTSIINQGRVGEGAYLGMAAVVIRPVEPRTLHVGNPAKKIKDI